jgi:integrase
MPRHRQPARLYFRKDEQQWVIRDGSTQKRTGFGLEQRGEAETALANYLAGKQPERRGGPAHPGELTVGEVLALYADDKGASFASAQTLAYSLQALAPFWADLTCDAIKGSTCRLYERERAKPRRIESTSKTGKAISRVVTASAPTVRRELGVLQAALNHAHEEGMLIHPISVSLPDEGAPRDRWLTRGEAAKLLRCAEPHVRRFILLSLYTGRRASAILELTWTRVELDRGTIRFRDAGEAETNKRRGAIRIPRQLRGHLSRWVAYRGTHVVMYRGKPVNSIKTGIRRAAERAGVEGVSPHVLKHTAITWAVSKGLGVEDAAEYFNTSPQTIRKHYWHHSPHHQARAIEAIERR